MLRDPNGPYKVDLVIALTHMRVPNDIKLAQSCDRKYYFRFVNFMC